MGMFVQRQHALSGSEEPRPIYKYVYCGLINDLGGQVVYIEIMATAQSNQLFFPAAHCCKGTRPAFQRLKRCAWLGYRAIIH